MVLCPQEHARGRSRDPGREVFARFRIAEGPVLCFNFLSSIEPMTEVMTMSDTGIKAAALSPRLFLANPIRTANIQAEEARKAAEKGGNLIVFPAMSLTGSTCGDLIRSQRLKRAAAEAVELLARETADLDAVIVTGVSRLVLWILPFLTLWYFLAIVKYLTHIRSTKRTRSF